jgi:hypothetical protein
MNILEARDKKGGTTASAKVKPPVRVVHLELQTGEAGGGSTTILGLAIPHGIAKKVIADLEASISKMFPKQELALGDAEMHVVSGDDDDDDDDDVMVKSPIVPSAIDITDVDGIDDVISVASEDVVSEQQQKSSRAKIPAKPIVHGSLVDKKPRTKDEKLFSILSEGKSGKSNGISDPALFDTLVRYSEGMTSQKHCPDQALKEEYFKAKEEGGALKTIKTVYYLGEAKIPTSKGTEDFHSYLELSWDGSGKWRRYAKKKAD